MKQSLIFTIMVLLLTIQTVIPQFIRNKPCPCGRGGPNCMWTKPQYCPPHKYRNRNTTKLTHKPIISCKKGSYRSCKKDKFGKEDCICKPIFYIKDREKN